MTTAFDFKAMMIMHAVLRGNGFAEIVPGPEPMSSRCRLPRSSRRRARCGRRCAAEFSAVRQRCERSTGSA